MSDWRTPTLVARFWAKVDQSAGVDACWPWTGAYSVKRGTRPRRPHFWVTRLKLIEGAPARQQPQLVVVAARMALALIDGTPPWERDGLEACHRPQICTSTNCVNPNHLYWGTPDENRADRYPQLQLGDLDCQV